MSSDVLKVGLKKEGAGGGGGGSRTTPTNNLIQQLSKFYPFTILKQVNILHHKSRRLHKK